MDVKQVTIRLPPELHGRFKMLAIKKGMKLGELVVETIKEKLKKEE